MRVLVAGFQHETNSFAPTPASWSAFERGDFFPAYTRGAAMLERHADGGLPMSGFLAAAKAAGWDVVPSCWAGASPSAAVTRDAFEHVRSALLEDLDAALLDGPLDGVYLDLHGAAVCEHLDAPEAALLAEVRARVGPDTGIVGSLDLHANVDAAMLEPADYLLAYRTYPHVDMLETGAVAFDVPHCGPTVWAYGDRAADIVDALRDAVVAEPSRWRAELLEADAAVAEALASTADGPVVIADAQDNPGAGADAGGPGCCGRCSTPARVGHDWGASRSGCSTIPPPRARPTRSGKGPPSICRSAPPCRHGAGRATRRSRAA